MKKTFFKILTIGTFAILAACSKTPESCFTVDKDKANIKVNEEVHFYSECSKDATGYKWDFGDGSLTGDASPKHKYSTKGTYTVKLTVDNDGNTAESTQTIIVY